MRGTMWLMALGGGLLLSSSGCCGFLRDGRCGQGCGCEGCDRCDGDCGPTCGPVGRPHRQHIYGDDGGRCGDCGNCGSCCDECGTCCQRNFCFHPFRWIGSLFYAGTWCGPSCGNTYWGEGISDPPDCHDPCNRTGQWTGRGGCANCNHGGGYQGGGYQGGDMSSLPDGATIQDDPPLEPTPALAPPKATRRAAPSNYDR